MKCNCDSDLNERYYIINQCCDLERSCARQMVPLEESMYAAMKDV